MAEAPSRTDPVVRALSQVIGGPHGSHAVEQPQRKFWSPTRVILFSAVVMFAAAWLQKLPCASGEWVDYSQYTQLCYSDIRALWGAERFDVGAIPYFQHPVEYPVLSGIFMGIAGLTSYALLGEAGGTLYYHLNAIGLLTCGVLAVVGLYQLRRARPWDAMMLAVAPIMLVTALVNWDLFTIALMMFALVAWAQRRTWRAGILLGLAVAAKFYPLLIIGPLLVLAIRHRRWLPALQTTVAAAITWLAVNAAFMLFAFDGWKRFFELNSERPIDWGTTWYVVRAFAAEGSGLAAALADVETLNWIYLVALVLCCCGIAYIGWSAPTPPRLAQLMFLVVAAFLLTGKVWSQQYVLWLLPLVVLARPQWRAFLLWQAAELFYFLAFYGQLLSVSGPDEDVPAWAVPSAEWVFVLASLARIAMVTTLCVLVIRDIYQPSRDIVRRTYGTDPDAGALLPLRDRPGDHNENTTTSP